ncbi:hypothetical protein JCM19294_704 [Nonlabens tegetincola]|uniref:GIY-YIG domain-containing protein n=1 Tax=Nonlabens tegetincola TaxID=323273 RepID=A0A090Q5Z9_9FLAO|nr:exonuclease domain-containing protein [Nonlabens tegetincola]GAK97198.1 hypothetical protein JCM19294_704 [Nonlabens tegetincola]
MYAILDIETTGGNYGDEGITEIAIYKFDGHEIVDQFASLVNPEKPIQPFVVQLTGINNKMLIKAPKFFEVAKRIIEITEGCVIVAHNAEFDYRMLVQEFSSLGYDYQRESICTVQVAQELLPDEESYNLGKLCKSLGIPIPSRHRATGDAVATVKLFKILLEKDTGKKIINSFQKQLAQKSVKKGLQEFLDSVPATTGVLYLFNEKNQSLYISKSRNMKKKLRQVVTSQVKWAANLTKKIHRVSYEQTGSLLIAEIKEYIEIKAQRPKFVRKRKAIHLKSVLNYKDNRIQINKIALPSRDGLIFFRSDKKAINFLKWLFSNSCQSPDDYIVNNELLQQLADIEHLKHGKSIDELLEEFNFMNGSYILKLRGRTATEHAVLKISNNKVQGYAYIDLKYQVTNSEILNKLLIPLNDDKGIFLNMVHQYIKTRKNIYKYKLV